jgi:hypothetical protein
MADAIALRGAACVAALSLELRRMRAGLKGVVISLIGIVTSARNRLCSEKIGSDKGALLCPRERGD